MCMTDSAANVVNQYAYDEFGNILGSSETTPNPFRFVGKYGVMDEGNGLGGLLFMRARYYDPEIGRFLSPDPIGFAGGDLNLYAYVGNNPINKIDPIGLFEWVNPVGFWNDAIRGGGDFWKNYQNMREANTIGADKYFHCVANCQASRRGLGDADRAANRQGRKGDWGIFVMVIPSWFFQAVAFIGIDWIRGKAIRTTGK